MTTILRNMRLLETERQRDLYEQRLDSGRNPHLFPGSTLIAALGNYWLPECFEAVNVMFHHTFNEGYVVSFYEESDRCLNGHNGLGLMRNMAMWKALAEGWEYLLYVDNDVKPEKDVLVKLLQRPVPILCPIVVYADGKDYGLTLPNMPQGQGLAITTSVVTSFLLFETRVFAKFLDGFWETAPGADESYHFAKLYAATGHRPWVDTDVVVTCMRGPTFPLDKHDAESA